MPVPSTLESLSPTAQLDPLAGDSVSAGDDNLRAAFQFIRQTVTAGSNISSAGTITPPSTGSSFTVTGVTTITAISSTNSWNGRMILLRFAGALQLTHSASFYLPGAANITTVANDWAIFREQSTSNWECVSYQRAAMPPTALGTSAQFIRADGVASNTLVGNISVPSIGNGAAHMSFAAAGNVTIAAPASGVAFTVTPNGLNSAITVTLNQNANTRGFLFTNTDAGALAVVGSVWSNGTSFLQIFQGGTGHSSFGNMSVMQADGAGGLLLDAFSGTLKLATALNTRYTINGSGNHTIAAPSSGASLTFGQAATQIVPGATSFALRNNLDNADRFVWLDDGRVYGTALHNNAGAVTGTTTQYIASGTYTPTATNVTNVTSSTPEVAQWTRVGNVVTVSGQIGIQPTAAGTLNVGLSIPVASNFTTQTQCSGAGATAGAGTAVPAVIQADTTNDRANLLVGTQTGGTVNWNYTFTYVVV